LTAGYSRVPLKKIHPFTTLSDSHDSAQHSNKKREERKREQDTKNGKHQKLQEKRKSDVKKQADTDKKIQGKILKQKRTHKESSAVTERIGHINPREMLTLGKVLSLQKLGKVTLVLNKYTCLIEKDHIEHDRKNILSCKVSLRILHRQHMRKMISVETARQPTSELDKGEIRLKLPRL